LVEHVLALCEVIRVRAERDVDDRMMPAPARRLRPGSSSTVAMLAVADVERLLVLAGEDHVHDFPIAFVGLPDDVGRERENVTLAASRFKMG
jgi:hypothetical protein